ncbi:hypothetical protein [Tateyamaria pelophila]|uniref:hypothetical protein n=1 Tax=Tateyamaria pelophila TaxID=328415 RepID=UPI001CC08FFD|nr:hypothetical protein [Tateyamaria pelophila]
MPVCIMTPIRQHGFGGSQTYRRRRRVDALVTLARRQEHPQGMAQSIRDGVKLGIYPTFGLADQAATPPFCSPRLGGCAVRFQMHSIRGLAVETKFR